MNNSYDDIVIGAGTAGCVFCQVVGRTGLPGFSRGEGSKRKIGQPFKAFVSAWLRSQGEFSG